MLKMPSWQEKIIAKGPLRIELMQLYTQTRAAVDCGKCFRYLPSRKESSQKVHQRIE